MMRGRPQRSVHPPSDFGKLIVEETEKWAKVVKLSGAKLD
jgi:hypothetical protein